jgi:hypothetical protein
MSFCNNYAIFICFQRNYFVRFWAIFYLLHKELSSNRFWIFPKIYWDNTFNDTVNAFKVRKFLYIRWDIYWPKSVSITSNNNCQNESFGKFLIEIYLQLSFKFIYFVISFRSRSLFYHCLPFQWHKSLSAQVFPSTH